MIASTVSSEKGLHIHYWGFPPTSGYDKIYLIYHLPPKDVQVYKWGWLSRLLRWYPLLTVDSHSTVKVSLTSWVNAKFFYNVFKMVLIIVGPSIISSFLGGTYLTTSSKCPYNCSTMPSYAVDVGAYTRIMFSLTGCVCNFRWITLYLVFDNS